MQAWFSCSVIHRYTSHVKLSFAGAGSIAFIGSSKLLHLSEALAVVVVVGAEMVLIIDLTRVAFVADVAIEEIEDDRCETEEAAEGKIFEDAVIWVRSLVRRVV